MDKITSFVKTAKELQLTHENEVVKIAGILDRLKKLWNSITNPQYRQSVELLQTENQQTQHQIQQINDALLELSQALESGDLQAYSQVLEKIKILTGKFVDELKETDKKAKQVFSWTFQEMQEPGFLNQLSEHLPKEYDLEIGKEYNVPLKEFSWYKNINPSVFINESGRVNVLSVLLGKIKDVLRSYYNQNISNDKMQKMISTVQNNKEELMNNFQQAILNGTVLAARPLLPAKGQRAQAGQTEIDVRTAPFNIPEIGGKLQAQVSLRDLRTSLGEKKRLSLRRTKSIELVEPPRIVQAKFAQAENRVPYQRKTLSEVEFAKVLKEAYQELFGHSPSAEVLGGIWAQAVFESGRPIKLPNNNVGNIKATSSWIQQGNPYFVKGTIEFTPEGKKYKEHGTKWKAFPTPVEGAKEYLRLLKSRYGRALEWFEAGDPESAGVTLALKGYYTAPITVYSGGVKRLYEYFMKNIAPKLSGVQSGPAPPPTAKPPMKKFVSHYTKEEKEEALRESSKQPSTPEQPSEGLSQQVDSLVRNLLTSQNHYRMFKNSNKSPSDVLIVIKSSDSFTAQLEYARKLASIIQYDLGIETDICSNGDKIEIQCESFDSPDILIPTLQFISNAMSKTLYQKTGFKVGASILPDFISKYGSIETDMLVSNYRKFNLQRIGHGRN